MGTFFYDPYTEFDFGNLGFPDEISVMVNRMVRSIVRTINFFSSRLNFNKALDCNC